MINKSLKTLLLGAKQLPNGCLERFKCINSAGYSNFKYKGRLIGAHRASWIFHRGIIPKKLFVCHKCDNPRCINPAHLFLGTAKDNSQDIIKKGRWPDRRGENSPLHKLNNEKVKQIRNKIQLGFNQTQLAEEYKTSTRNIRKIRDFKSWANVEMK